MQFHMEVFDRFARVLSIKIHSRIDIALPELLDPGKSAETQPNHWRELIVTIQQQQHTCYISYVT